MTNTVFSTFCEKKNRKSGKFRIFDFFKHGQFSKFFLTNHLLRMNGTKKIVFRFGGGTLRWNSWFLGKPVKFKKLAFCKKMWRMKFWRQQFLKTGFLKNGSYDIWACFSSPIWRSQKLFGKNNITTFLFGAINVSNFYI